MAVLGLSEPVVAVVAFLAAYVTTAKFVPSVERSTLKPVSLAAVSVQFRRTVVAESADAVTPVGAPGGEKVVASARLDQAELPKLSYERTRKVYDVPWMRE